ncbi:hypothetical protein DL765_006902 [Monosporascus sp. GIB2]|nr:hypothetical protein DL765_006902 [Monosporascus sp. GIB2]
MALWDTPDLVLAKGSFILVTGASGYVASNIIAEALEAGYRVRGTSRSEARARATAEIFQSADYEAVVTDRMDAEGAFDAAVEGVDEIIHVATPTSWSSDPREVVGPAVQAITLILASAARELRVKRFVYASSSVAATLAKPNQKFRIDRNSWNDEVEAYATQPGDPYRIYSASKVRTERALWDFVREHQPSFVGNSVVANFNIGRIIGEKTWSSKILIDIYEGKTEFMIGFPPQHMINVVDNARLHLIAAIDGTLENERIFAFPYPYINLH